MTAVREHPADRSAPSRRSDAQAPTRRIRGDGASAGRSWRSAYVRRLVVTDALSAAVAAVLGYLARFGTDPLPGAGASLVLWPLLPVVWVVAMQVARSYEQRFLWVGADEYRRVFGAAVLLLAAVGTASWALRLEVARGFVVVALPVATVLTLWARHRRRKAVHRARARGDCSQTTLVVGHRSGVAALDEQLRREARYGYVVIGCCLPTGQHEDTTAGVPPVLGDLGEVADVVRRYSVDTVAVLPCPELDGAALRRLGWELEETEAELLLAPALTEVVGPRVHIRPVCGLPLLHVERPELRGARRLTKEVVDRTAALLGLLLLAPVIVAVAIAVKVDSPGPVLFRQQRVGRHGRVFSMLKFRSMVVGADQLVDALASESDGNGVLFKKRTDPRVTRVGRLLRRLSLDELPQLVNVIAGDMSLVGPRPPLQREVELYGFDMHRRFLVKPGLTGLWQVSGRSDLSWDDSVRIDLRYVENWSLTYDLMILRKTVGAVLRGSGAY